MCKLECGAYYLMPCPYHNGNPTTTIVAKLLSYKIYLNTGFCIVDYEYYDMKGNCIGTTIMGSKDFQRNVMKRVQPKTS